MGIQNENSGLLLNPLFRQLAEKVVGQVSSAKTISVPVTLSRVSVGPHT